MAGRLHSHMGAAFRRRGTVVVVVVVVVVIVGVVWRSDAAGVADDAGAEGTQSGDESAVTANEWR